MEQKRNVLVPILLLAAFAVTRWPGLMPPNFSVVFGLVFCAGAFPLRLSPWAVLAVLIGTDLALNAFYYQTVLFSDYQLVNYLAYAGIFFLGRQFTAKSHLLKLVGGGLLGALVFYLVTNTAAWLQNPEYQKTLLEWVRAQTTGTTGWPASWTFFRNTLLSGGLFTGVIAAALKSSEAEEPQPDPEPEAEPAGKPQPETK